MITTTQREMALGHVNDPDLGLCCTSSVNETTVPSAEGTATLVAGDKGTPNDGLCL